MCYCSNAGVEWVLTLMSAQKVDLEEENSPTALARTQTHDLLIMSLMLYH